MVYARASNTEHKIPTSIHALMLTVLYLYSVQLTLARFTPAVVTGSCTFLKLLRSSNQQNSLPRRVAGSVI